MIELLVYAEIKFKNIILQISYPTKVCIVYVTSTQIEENDTELTRSRRGGTLNNRISYITTTDAYQIEFVLDLNFKIESMMKSYNIATKIMKNIYQKQNHTITK